MLVYYIVDLAISCISICILQATTNLQSSVINPGCNLGDHGERISFEKPHCIHGLVWSITWCPDWVRGFD